MNSTDLTDIFESQNWELPQSFPLTALRIAAAAAFAYPLVGNRVQCAVANTFSYLCSATQEAYSKCAPQFIQRGVELTDVAVVKGAGVLNEVFDFANFGGTKDPQASVAKSLERLKQHDAPFAECCEFLANAAAETYILHEHSIKEKASEFVNQRSFDFFGRLVKWFMDLSKDLIAQTVKANILHVLANLADAGFEAKHPFGDRQRNPFGRILSVIGVCLSNFEQRLEDIEKSPTDQKEALYSQLFQEISNTLLAKLFPKGAEDLQLFHHTIPVTLFKDFAWSQVKGKLPGLLEKMYKETRPLAEQHPRWEEGFELESQGLKASQMVTLPSSLYHYFLKGRVGKLLDEQKPEISAWLKAKGISKNDQLAGLMLRYTTEFLETKDASLAKMGSFIEKYLMERLLFNLSNYTPNDVDIPMPQYLIQKWVEGDCFKMLHSCLSGDRRAAKQSISGAVQDILKPFGLDQIETFPLPATILQHAWPFIQRFQSTSLPDRLLQAIPQWIVLSKQARNQKEVVALLSDDSLIDSCRKKAMVVIDKEIDKFVNEEHSTFSRINALLPNQPLSLDQQDGLDAQFDEFLDKNNPSHAILLKFGKQCVESFIFQICNDLYAHYLDACAHEGLRGLFDDTKEAAEDDTIDSFPQWLIKELANAFDDLDPETFSDQEAEVLKRAVKLQHAIRYDSDASQKKKDQAEFDKAWKMLSPKMEKVSLELFGRLGYSGFEKLPFPKPVQKFIWNKIHSTLPYLLFTEGGWILELLFEKKSLRREVEALPHGQLLAKGCRYFAQDVSDHLPEWIENEIDRVPTLIQEKIPDVELGNQTKESLLRHLNSFIFQEKSTYDSIWNLIEDYLECMSLKIVVGLSQLSQEGLQKIKTLIQNARDQLIALEEQGAQNALDGKEEVDDEKSRVYPAVKTKNEIVEGLTDQVMQVLGINGEHDLFGIPSLIRQPLLAEGRKKIAEGLLTIYQWDAVIRNHAIDEAAVEKHLPLSKVSGTVLILIRYVLDQTTDHLSARDDEGKLEIVQKLLPSINHFLEKQAEKEYQFAEFVREIIDEEIAFPFLKDFFDLLDHNQTRPYKEQLADWIAPFITNHVASAVLPLLEKEKRESPHFDKALLLAMLPIATRHLEHLNQAAHKEGGLTFRNFLEAAGDALHPDLLALQNDDEAKIEQAAFYQNQTSLIFQAIFPNGKDDLLKLLPQVNVEPEQADLLWDMAQTTLSSNLPLALDAFLSKDFLIEFFNDLFEELLEKLDDPFSFKNEEESSGKLLFEDNSDMHALDCAIGRFVLEGAQFLELPMMSLQNVPAWFKKMIGTKSIEQKAIEIIGSSVRKKIDGELLPKVVARALHRLSKKKHIKMTKQEKKEAKIQAAQDLKNLEKKLIQKGLEFFFLSVNDRFVKTSDAIKNPILKKLVEGYLAIYSFVICRILVPFIHMIHLDRITISYLNGIFERAIGKIIRVFSEPQLHEDLLFSEIEAFQKVLQHP